MLDTRLLRQHSKRLSERETERERNRGNKNALLNTHTRVVQYTTTAVTASDIPNESSVLLFSGHAGEGPPRPQA